MKRICQLLALLFLLTNQVAYSAEIVGTGRGSTEAEARREALSDLSSRISITVRSNFKSTQTVNSLISEKKNAETVFQAAVKTMETNSELPILGAEFASSAEGSQVSVNAILETSKSLPLYTARLSELQARMLSLNKQVSNEKNGAAQYASIMDIFTLLDEFKKLNTVNTYLSGNPQTPGIDEDALQNKIRSVRSQADSLDLAAQFLTEGISASNIYIFPAKTKNSNEITPFAALLKDKLSKYLKTTLSPSGASFTFVGQYDESNTGVDVTYHLIDDTSLAHKTNSVHVIKAAYSGLATTPTTTDFDQLLKAGVAMSGNLRVDVSTNLGKRDLLFHQGDELELLVKLSEPGYFYAIGHTVKETENKSYLVELREADGPRKFVYFVNADDANKWISIGKFQVEAPFGVEGLQVYASNKDLADSLPATKLDSTTGLYVVDAANRKEGVVKTRALIKKFAKTAETSEASLMFTTKTR